MGILEKIFRRGERTKKSPAIETTVLQYDELERICSDSPDVYEALKKFMFLNPTKINVSLKDAVLKAKELEKAKDKLRAAVWYRIAGGLAIYEGDVAKVKEYFGKYCKLTGKDVKIVEVAEKVVRKAQEYYTKYLKKEER